LLSETTTPVVVVCKLPTKVVTADESAEAGDDDEEEECEESSIAADEGLTQQASVRHAIAMALVVGHSLTATAKQLQTTAQSSRELTYPN
jgi:hypothetical protein